MPQEAATTERELNCERCGGGFGCGAGSASCWCASITLPEEGTAALRSNFNDCLCPNCLEEVSRKTNSQERAEETK